MIYGKYSCYCRRMLQNANFRPYCREARLVRPRIWLKIKYHIWTQDRTSLHFVWFCTPRQYEIPHKRQPEKGIKKADAGAGTGLQWHQPLLNKRSDIRESYYLFWTSFTSLSSRVKAPLPTVPSKPMRIRSPVLPLIFQP